MPRRRHRARPDRLVAALVAAGLAGACTAAPASRPGGSSSEPPAVAPTRLPPPAGVVRTCESSVYGELEPGWRRDSVVAGPLAFVSLRQAATWPADQLRKRSGGYPGQKVLAVVETGATVTVTVPAAERRHLALLYDPSAWAPGDNLYQVADGDPVVTFEGCRAGESPYGADTTQFNGGFVVVGARCATLEVSTPTSSRPRRVPISFGAGRCRS
jgi:hypothetical protein